MCAAFRAGLRDMRLRAWIPAFAGMTIFFVDTR
jgi:hypothetical protein